MLSEEIHCPKCGSADYMPGDEGMWPACNDCGFTDYDADTLALQAEVKREQADVKQRWGYVPTYAEFLKGENHEKN